MENKDKIPNFEGQDFQAPKGYFDKLEDDLLSRISGKKYVLESNIPHPFTTPDFYFEGLEQDVLEQTVLLNSAPHSMSVTHKRSFVSYYRVAAAAILIFVGAFWFLNRTENTETIALDAISNEEILAYLEDEKLNSEDLYNIVKDEIDTNIGIEELNEEELLDFIDGDYLDNEI
jgi:hypothetical protein